MIIGSLVLTHYQRVSDRQTDGHAAYKSKSRYNLAERDKNRYRVNTD